MRITGLLVSGSLMFVALISYKQAMLELDNLVL